MRSRARRLAGPAAILASLLVAAAPTPVEALEPPAGVLFDGRLTVVVIGSAGSDTGSQMALAGASVTVVATTGEGSAEVPVGEPLAGVTGPDGSVELTGVARPVGASRAVHLAVDAFRRAETIDADGCTTTEVWAGDVAGVVAPPPTPLVVAATRVVTSVCATGPVIEGRLLDSRGEPLVTSDAWVEVAARGEEARVVDLAVGPDGSFLAELPAIGTWTEPAAVTLRAMSAVTRREPFGRDCVRTWADAVSWSRAAALAEGATLPWLDLAATETVVGERCGAVSSAAPVPTAEAPGAATARPSATRPPLARPAGSASTQTPAPAPSEPTGAVAGRTALPGPASSAGPPVTDARTMTPGASAEMVALLVALVAMAVTLAIVIRISRRA